MIIKLLGILFWVCIILVLGLFMGKTTISSTGMNIERPGLFLGYITMAFVFVIYITTEDN